MDSYSEFSLYHSMDHLYIGPDQQTFIVDRLKELYQHHKPTAEHCIRVGNLAENIARFMNVDPKPAFYGILHDIGKLDVPNILLEKTATFTEEDMNIVRKHVLTGYDRLNPTHPFSAQLALRHHRYQANPYPTTVQSKFSLAMENYVELYSRIVSIADVYDALHRKNDSRPVYTQEQVKEQMYKKHPEHTYLLHGLYKDKILK